MAKKNEVAVTNGADEVFPLAISGTNLREVMAETLGSETLDMLDLERIKVPSQGSTLWTIDGLDGEETIKEVEGVLIWHRNVRLYWKASIDDAGGGAPPDCVSDDAINGVGDPGGLCLSCPKAAWGTAKGGTAAGQSCQQRHVMCILQANSVLPTIISAPPTSLKSVKHFLVKLARHSIRAHDIVIGFTLEPDKNAAGTKYSRIKLRRVGNLTDEQKAAVRAYRDAITPHLNRTSVMDIAGDDVIDTEPTDDGTM
jgi:hypothetical protein